MFLGHAARLDTDRRRLTEGLASFDAHLDLEIAEAIRPTLVEALESLKALYEDAEVWAAAQSAVKACPPVDLVGRMGGFPQSLPPLLELFGYRVPPPPPAAQLVSEAIALLSTPPSAAKPAEEVRRARRALGDLLERTLPLATSSDVVEAAAETIPAVEAGILIATGAATGAITVLAGASVVAGAATGGIGAAAPFLIVAGIRRFLRHRSVRRRKAEEGLYRLERSTDLLPAARAALLHHFDAIADPVHQLLDKDPVDGFDAEVHLGAIIDLARRFAVHDQHLTTQAKQQALNGWPGPKNLLTIFRELHPVAVAARTDLATHGSIGCTHVERLNQLAHRVRQLDLTEHQLRAAPPRPKGLERPRPPADTE